MEGWKQSLQLAEGAAVTALRGVLSLNEAPPAER